MYAPPKSAAPDLRTKAVFFFCALVVIGLFTGKQIRVLPSIGIIGLLLTALTQKNISSRFSELRQQKSLLAFMGIFLIHALTFIYSDAANYTTYWESFILKIPLLLLPLAFGLLPGIRERNLYLLYYLFFLCVIAATLYSLTKYTLNFEFVNESYLRSKVMPTWVNHVRFSLMAAMAFFVGCRLWQKKVYFFYKAERLFILSATILLFVYLHMLAVRSGLMALYGIIGLGLLYFILIKRKIWLGLGLGILLALVPVISYFTLPTFYNKFHNTLSDVKEVDTGGSASANDYSLVGRVYSYKVGMILIRQNPLLGVGMGDWRAELKKTYQQHYPQILETSHLIPHSQFMYVVMLLGSIGFIIFLFFFYYPLYAHFRQADILFGLQYVVVTLSFFSEATLETQLGLLFSIIFILLPIFQLKYKTQAPKI